MAKVTGIKSVDLKIKALGHGVVNWNGPTPVKPHETSKKKEDLKNHSMPKLRGYTNLTGVVSEKGFKFKKEATDIDFKKTPLYVSQNCIRHHLFRTQAVDLQNQAVTAHLDKVLCSMTGLIRGYVVPDSQCKRTSPLLVTDFVDKLFNGNYEQMGRSGSKEKEETKSGEEKSTSLFSKTTFGDTEYEGFASISIEQLQFISLDSKWARAAMANVSESDGIELAKKITAFTRSLGNSDAEAAFHNNYVRRGSIFDDGEAGILLNESAMDALVNETIELLRGLQIRQAKGYMYVDDVEVDYNNGSVGKDMMRIKHTPSSIQSKKQEDYAVYFEGKEL